jgi:hypothetical protein
MLLKITNPKVFIVVGNVALILGLLSLRVMKTLPDFYGGLAIGVFYTTAILMFYRYFRLRRAQ